MNLFRIILHSDGGPNFLLTNYDTLVLLKKSLVGFSQDFASEKLDDSFFAHMLDNHPFEDIRRNSFGSYAFSLNSLLETIRNLTNTMNRFFSSLYSLSEDHLLIKSLAELACKCNQSKTQAKVDSPQTDPPSDFKPERNALLVNDDHQGQNL